MPGRSLTRVSMQGSKQLTRHSALTTPTGCLSHAGMCVVSATVDTSKPRLLRYYEACGAQVVRSVAVGSGASAPPSVRIQYAFTEAMLRKQLRVSDAKVRRHHHARRRALAAAAAAAAAALWTAWARRRRLKADAHQ
jgi:hypothetical protein